MNRDDIHIISRHSNWTEAGIEKTLKSEVYSSSQEWKKFLQLLFISLGVGFSVTGIIFFFAYNWADLHKFAKIGMVEALIVLSASLVLFSKLNVNIKNILLTATAVLVGVLFAVFGQIYQTGANAYDFFLGWTLFITLWVVFSNYPLLWLVYLVLIQTTLVLYAEQVASGWSVFIINTTALLGMEYLPRIISGLKVPAWLSNLVALAAVSLSTIGITVGIFDNYEISLLVLILMAVLFYSSGIIYGLKAKKAFYLSIIPFSLIVIISALLVKISDDAIMFFTISLFIIASVTLLIASLMNIQKKWRNEEDGK